MASRIARDSNPSSKPTRLPTRPSRRNSARPSAVVDGLPFDLILIHCDCGRSLDSRVPYGCKRRGPIRLKGDNSRYVAFDEASGGSHWTLCRGLISPYEGLSDWDGEVAFFFRNNNGSLTFERLLAPAGAGSCRREVRRLEHASHLVMQRRSHVACDSGERQQRELVRAVCGSRAALARRSSRDCT